jgi:hypothetical protein
VWDFIQGEVFGMKWLNRLIGYFLNACGLDTSGKLDGSLQFFIYDTIPPIPLILLSSASRAGRSIVFPVHRGAHLHT